MLGPLGLFYAAVILTIVLAISSTVQGQSPDSGEAGWLKLDAQGNGIKRPDGFDIDRAAFAEFWVGRKLNSMVPLFGPIRLKDGRFKAGLVEIPGYSVGDSIWIQLKICFGSDFRIEDCCGFSPAQEVELYSQDDSRHEFSGLYFGRFTLCSDCDPDACYIEPTSVSINRNGGQIEVRWTGGRLDSATAIEGPYEPESPFLTSESSGFIRSDLSDPTKFYRVGDPCLEPETIDPSVDYIRDGEVSSFWESYLERLLRVMGEPSILPSSRNEVEESYRMIFLPSFGLPTVVRIERNGDEFVKKTVRTGHYSSDLERCILAQSFETLSEEQWDAFKKDFTELEFWSLPTEETDVNLLDGAPTFTEVRLGDQYHIVYRTTPSYKTRARGLKDYLALYEKHVVVPWP